MMNNQQKKVYTMEDNVKSISFGVKDLVKQLEEMNTYMLQIATALGQKNDDGKDLPF